MADRAAIEGACGPTTNAGWDKARNGTPLSHSLLNIEPGWRIPFGGPAGRTRAPVIVVYHNLTTAASPLTAKLNISIEAERFRRHVRYFARNYDLIAPSDLLSPNLPKRPLLITFDDVYKSVLDIGGPTLREFHAPSIWFLNPDSIEEEALPLDNLLSWAVQALGSREVGQLVGTKPEADHSAPGVISNRISRLSLAQVAALRESLCSRLGESQTDLRRRSGLFITAQDLAQLPAFGMQAGNHSKTHSFFRSLTPDELDTEIRISREALERLSGQTVRYLAIPYGNELDSTQEALTVARSSGHDAIFLVHARHNGRRPAPDVFYRIDTGGVSTMLLPAVMNVLPRLRSAWHSGW